MTIIQLYTWSWSSSVFWLAAFIFSIKLLLLLLLLLSLVGGVTNRGVICGVPSGVCSSIYKKTHWWFFCWVSSAFTFLEKRFLRKTLAHRF